MLHIESSEKKGKVHLTQPVNLHDYGVKHMSGDRDIPLVTSILPVAWQKSVVLQDRNVKLGPNEAFARWLDCHVLCIYVCFISYI